jgi:hypothetical protein
MRAVCLIAGLILAVPAAAAAQEAPKADCGAASAPGLPPGFARWASPSPLTPAARPADLPGAALTIGTAAHGRLHPESEVVFPLPPQKPGQAASHGGLFALAIDQPGTYRIALSSGAWIDVVRDKTALDASAHEHGPACTGVRKIVDFTLQPGRYVIQVSGSAEAEISLMVVRRP